MNKKRKVLPINKTPSVRTCIHYAYPLAIIQSEELADVEFSPYSLDSWKSITENTTFKIDGNSIKIYQSKAGKKSNTIFFRKYKLNDEVVVKINYMKLQDMGRYIDLFLFQDNLEEEISNEDKSCGIRWNPYGFFVGKDRYDIDVFKYVYIKLKAEEDKIDCYASSDGIEWNLFRQKEIPKNFRTKDLMIGVHIYSGIERYPLFEMMNYIQLIYNTANAYKGIGLDYYFFPRKNPDNSYGYFSNFVDASYEILYDQLDCFSSIHDYLHWNINHNYYVELCLNEYYVVDREYYMKQKYTHYNMFYGYDDNEQEYYLMGYGKDSTPIVSKLSYESMDDLEIIRDSKIIKYRFRENEVSPIEFQIKSVILAVYEYLHDIDSSEKLCNLFTEEPLHYGISILKMLGTSDYGKNDLKVDKRISFLLYEHCTLMKKRLSFLYENGYLNLESYETLEPLCDNMVSTARILLSLVLRYAITNRKEEDIYQTVLLLYEKEKEFYQILLDALIQCNNVSLLEVSHKLA